MALLPITQPGIEEVRGPLAGLNPLTREVTLLVDGQKVELDLAPDCLIELHGEPVRLRMLQVGDIVQVVLAGPRQAQSIRVQPLCS
jgi:hypothetical protein